MVAGLTTRTIVGLEIHVQLATRTKLFCGCALEFGAEPNSRTCPVCLGLPGALPVMNRAAYEASVRFALAMNCKIAAFTKWDRKSYYYPDLPKNYQISQYDLPLGYEGFCDIDVEGGESKRIRIRRAHLEEDAGKNLHDVPGCSLVDLNRTGTPLLEIVTEPDIASAQEAFDFCTGLQKLAVYLGVSEASMQKGHMRFEPNINVEITRGNDVYRTPISEVKNLNSFRAVRDAIEYETQRQVQDWLSDENYVFGKAANENRGWNADKQMTEYQRSKEAAHDYRYFPDPDLMPVTTSADWVEKVRGELPEGPTVRRDRLVSEFGLSPGDADLIVADRGDADLFDAAIDGDKTLAKRMTSLMLGAAKKSANDRDLTVSAVLANAASWRQLVRMLEDGVVNASAGERLLLEAMEGDAGEVDFEQMAKDRNLVQVQDVGQMSAWVEQVFKDNAGAVEDALSNPKKAKAAPGFLTGKVMQISGGKADPKVVGQLIAAKIKEMQAG
ncbi:MAG: Asp-tRNA(Asn)/Glu-tRNA(Gln) amidotransferase subunit GatB [Phycisphaerae bacterium]